MTQLNLFCHKTAGGWFIVAFCLFSRGGLATASSQAIDLQLRSIVTAGSNAELKSKLTSLDQIDRLQEQCDVQLSGKRLPTACFEVLKKQRLVPTEKTARLISICLQRVKVSRDIEELRRAVQTDAVPKKCSLAAAERTEDLRYSIETEHPTELFTNDFKGSGE